MSTISVTGDIVAALQLTAEHQANCIARLVTVIETLDVRIEALERQNEELP
jgi:chaperonin cofactor prefoldin